MQTSGRFITVRCTGCGERFRRWESNKHTCPYCRREVVEVKDA